MPKKNHKIHSNSKIEKLSGSVKFICVGAILLALLALAASLLYMTPSARIKIYSRAERTDGITAAALTKDFLTCGKDTAAWTMEISALPANKLEALFFRDRGALLRTWLDADGKAVSYFSFQGVDLGTGLRGEYYTACIDGINYVIDMAAKRAYPEGNAHYTELYAKLSPLSYAAITESYAEALRGSWVGKNQAGNYVMENPEGYYFALLPQGSYGAALLDASQADWLEYQIRGFATHSFTIELDGITFE